MKELLEPITNSEDLSRGFVFRDGFVFTAITEPSNVYDGLVVRESSRSTCSTPNLPVSSRTFEEHISLIRRHGLKKAYVFAEDIDWIVSCSSLEAVCVCPSDAAEKGFDFSPLKQLPNLKWLNCRNHYGKVEELCSVVDYSGFPALSSLTVDGNSHVFYEKLQSLKTLSISRDRHHQTLEDFSCRNLKDLSLVQCSMKSLRGIESLPLIQSLDIANLRSLKDVSDLCSVSNQLRLLSIESCPGITDFSFLESMTELEHLILLGKNELSDLSFLKNMPKLKTFTFSMNVLDGDLQPCMMVPYASCLKWHRHYNLRDRDLPKKLPLEAFEIR